ncbi:hypothetical protein [uncultured Arsenicicoccus sp.]|jgi:hypothetical protein|uniref:hypothetical protein n=1 Tax=uncultured Arsenicicoccus sp. TaxID=491339 RepID=UPI0025958495|nr:hypothetical protein [uncultured Arsenicicoccus sp.]
MPDYDLNAPASQRQHRTEVTGWPGYWATREGGEVEAETAKVWDGGSLKPSTLTGPAETGNVTVSTPYRPGRHGALASKYAKLVGRWRTTIKVYDTDPDLVAVGQPIVYADALLVRLKRPEGDAASSDSGVIELEFAVDGEA